MSGRQWSRDLAMGARFAFTGGRDGWARMLLTAVGVGLGVALLLLATALPNALAVRHDREDARTDLTFGTQRALGESPLRKADDTLLVGWAGTTFRDKEVRGRSLQPEGPKAPLPPGISRFPGAGEMVVSPALKRLLASGEGKMLRERLPERIVGTIAEPGLIGAQELAFYRGADNLVVKENSGEVERIDRFGTGYKTPEKTDPVLVLLALVVFLVLLLPVGVFIAAAVRFGGERRDRRLAALRLVGSDSRMTRRIAAGEAFAGAVAGLAIGTVFFLLIRGLSGSVDLFDVSVFPSYLTPSPLLALLVAVAVPAAAVLVTLFALRSVVIEPLGVVRTAQPPRRRLWWRLLLPLGGIGMLYPMIGKDRYGKDFNQYQVTGGVLLLLVGVTALLPWVVETVVNRLGSGGVAWQLAIRRLQLSSGTAARMVNGIAVAVAGAIALQMLFSGLQGQYTKHTTNDVTRAQMHADLWDKVPLAQAAAGFKATKGVAKVYAFDEGVVGNRRKAADNQDYANVTIADCASLRTAASLPSCKDGDSFVLRGGEADEEVAPGMSKPGSTLWFDTTDGSGAKRTPWTVPADLKQARAIADPSGNKRSGLLLTPGALRPGATPALHGQIYLALDQKLADAPDYARNTARRLGLTGDPVMLVSSKSNDTYASIRTGLFVGAACVLALIGASLLVSQLEQLRERRKLLSSLIAFGTRRRTLTLSVLWQTAIPIGLGLALATAIGLTLGAALLKMAAKPVGVDWASVLSMTGIATAVVLLVTMLSLPPLLRLMRPDGLRTE
ncbi:ABC transporter permease [Streptomyces sp. T12]|uniref:ABC transporter permease n=1 Tax=Streptomyces sp. T12 TaxID=477697 RepID=UPI002365A0EC|nr:FtsX-like permease family protein [Streptomyces sp. T12]WDF35825.1 ABC transporter permease [Streptomyces sp. T12]